MRLITLPLLLSAALLSVATAATPASVAVNATVEDACEIIGTSTILFDYAAAVATPTIGIGQVDVRCNLDSGPFLAYWDDTQWNANGSVDLMNGTNKLNVMLSADVDPTPVSAPRDGSSYVYNLNATAAAGQWMAPTGAYTKVVDFYVGW